ncbi:hypothetical protein [Variovorax sp. AFSI2.2]|uniref:hypothetical protein n=1 Tax=Variovorax sp. AFSI2.2 TaxID=3384160 RepID=UPI003EC0B6D1
MAISKYEWACIHERLEAAKAEAAELAGGAMAVAVLMAGLLFGQIHYKDSVLLVWLLSIAAAYFTFRSVVKPFRKRHTASLETLHLTPPDED